VDSGHTVDDDCLEHSGEFQVSYIERA
jgi:hypothetical protein